MRDPAAFEERYRAEGDPWSFASSPTELARYERLAAVLERDRYRQAYEPGCAVGVLTERLAPRCDRLRAVDLAPSAVAQAQARCAGLPQVTVAVGSMAEDPGPGHDLVVFSEVGYYVEADALAEVVDVLVAALVPGGELVGCHWLGHSDDHVLHGDTVHEVVDRHPGLVHRHHEHHGAVDPEPGRDGGYRLDTWTRR